MHRTKRVFFIMIKKIKTHFSIQENKIHLNKNESHPRGRSQCQQHIMTFRVPLQFEILSEFQSGVYHTSNPEGCRRMKKMLG